MGPAIPLPGLHPHPKQAMLDSETCIFMFKQHQPQQLRGANTPGVHRWMKKHTKYGPSTPRVPLGLRKEWSIDTCSCRGGLRYTTLKGGGRHNGHGFCFYEARSRHSHTERKRLSEVGGQGGVGALLLNSARDAKKFWLVAIVALHWEHT